MKTTMMKMVIRVLVISSIFVLVIQPSSSFQDDLHTEIESKNITMHLSANLINVEEARSSMSVLLHFTMIFNTTHVSNRRIGEDVTRAVEKGEIPLPRIDLPNPFCLSGRRETVEAVVVGRNRLQVRIRLDSNVPCFPKNTLYYPFDDLKCDLQVWVENWTPGDSPLDLMSISARRSVGPFIMTTSRIGRTNCPEHEVKREHGVKSFNNCFVLKFLLERHAGRLLVSVYLPTGMIVCLTFLLPWITFLVVPARAVVSGLSFLHLANHAVMSRSYIPSDAKYTFMDLWLNGCLLSAFFANLGFVLVHRANYGVQKLLDLDITDSESGIIKEEYLIGEAKRDLLSRRKSASAFGAVHPKRIDVWARLVLPTIFLIFNGVYWSIVLSLSHTY